MKKQQSEIQLTITIRPGSLSQTRLVMDLFEAMGRSLKEYFDKGHRDNNAQWNVTTKEA